MHHGVPDLHPGGPAVDHDPSGHQLQLADQLGGQVVEQVRQDGLPRTLPGQAEFATGATHLGATYEAAWVACLVLAERGGEEALVDLYDAVDCEELPPGFARRLQAQLGVPVYDGLGRAGHPTALLADWLPEPPSRAERQRWVVQAVMLGALA